MFKNKELDVLLTLLEHIGGGYLCDSRITDRKYLYFLYKPLKDKQWDEAIKAIKELWDSGRLMRSKYDYEVSCLFLKAIEKDEDFARLFIEWNSTGICWNDFCEFLHMFINRTFSEEYWKEIGDYVINNKEYFWIRTSFSFGESWLRSFVGRLWTLSFPEEWKKIPILKRKDITTFILTQLITDNTSILQEIKNWETQIIKNYFSFFISKPLFAEKNFFDELWSLYSHIEDREERTIHIINKIWEEK